MSEDKEKAMTEESIRITDAIAEIKKKEGYSWNDLAKKTGVPQGTISQVVTRKYQGNMEKYVDILADWLRKKEIKPSCRICRYHIGISCRRHAPITRMSGSIAALHWPNVNRNDWYGDFRGEDDGF